jgi:hypothetical protein
VAALRLATMFNHARTTLREGWIYGQKSRILLALSNRSGIILVMG